MDSFTGVTVALDETGEVCGYVLWERGQGFGEDAVIAVSDLLATGADGYRALSATVGSFSSVTARTTPGPRDPTWCGCSCRPRTGGGPWLAVSMVKVLDVPERSGCAATCRVSPPSCSFDWLATSRGRERRHVPDFGRERPGRGRGRRRRRLDRGPHAAMASAMYAGAQSSANLRAAGHLHGAARSRTTWTGTPPSAAARPTSATSTSPGGGRLSKATEDRPDLGPGLRGSRPPRPAYLCSSFSTLTPLSMVAPRLTLPEHRAQEWFWNPITTTGPPVSVVGPSRSRRCGRCRPREPHAGTVAVDGLGLAVVLRDHHGPARSAAAWWHTPGPPWPRTRASPRSPRRRS